MVITWLIMKVRIKKILFAAFLCSLFAKAAFAGLSERIDAIINQASQKKVQFGICIVKAETGKAVYSHNAEKAMIPASNMKIVITAAALEYLGADYEYKTKVGLCDDTLVITGSGDPLLADKVTDAKYNRKAGWIFEDIAGKLKEAGITTINDIVVDSSIFDDNRVHPNWPGQQLNKWYACEVSGLNFNGNCIEVTAENIGGKVVIATEPATGFVKITDKVAAISKGRSAVGAYRVPGKANHLIIKGKCRRKQGPFAVAIEQPAAFFGFVLAENLTKRGIITKGKLLEKPAGADCKLKILAQYSTPMDECLARCNKDSFGLAAEALLKTIAANANADKKNGSWAGGAEIIRQYLLGLGIKENQFYIDDGSGLSRENKLSASAITGVLTNVYKSKNRQLYKDCLAVGGVDGTIGKYFKEEEYKGKIFGKTGYINKVKSFSGLCSTESGDYIFSILANNTNGQTRTAINDIAKAIVDSR